MLFKKRNLFLAGAICIVLIGGGILISKGNSQNTDLIEEQIKIKDVKTYYNFSGDIKAKDSKQTVLSNTYTIDEILVKEGEIVKKDDILFKTTSGNKIKADMAGMITDILVNEDVKYNAGTHAATIIDTDALQVEIKIDEYDANGIEIDDEVEVYINALDKTVEGKIINLSKNATVTNGISYFRGVVEITDTTDILVGMSVEVKAIKDSVQNAKTISINAIEFDEDNQPYVYIKDSNGNIVEKSISIGINDGSSVEIKSGLKDSDTVVSSTSTDIFDFGMMMQHGGN